MDFLESITTNHDATVLTVNFHFWLPIQRVLDLYNLMLLPTKGHVVTKAVSFHVQLFGQVSSPSP